MACNPGWCPHCNRTEAHSPHNLYAHSNMRTRVGLCEPRLTPCIANTVLGALLEGLEQHIHDVHSAVVMHCAMRPHGCLIHAFKIKLLSAEEHMERVEPAALHHAGHHAQVTDICGEVQTQADASEHSSSACACACSFNVIHDAALLHTGHQSTPCGAVQGLLHAAPWKHISTCLNCCLICTLIAVIPAVTHLQQQFVPQTASQPQVYQVFIDARVSGRGLLV